MSAEKFIEQYHSNVREVVEILERCLARIGRGEAPDYESVTVSGRINQLVSHIELHHDFPPELGCEFRRARRIGRGYVVKIREATKALTTGDLERCRTFTHMLKMESTGLVKRSR